VTNEEFMAVVDSRFERLLTHLDSKFEQIDKRFEQIDARFEQIDKRFEQIDKRFEQIDQRFEQVDARFEQVDARFDRIELRLTNVETGLRYANVQIESLWGQTKRLAESIALVDEKLERFRLETSASFDEQRVFNAMLVQRIEAM